MTSLEKEKLIRNNKGKRQALWATAKYAPRIKVHKRGQCRFGFSRKHMTQMSPRFENRLKTAPY